MQGAPPCVRLIRAFMAAARPPFSSPADSPPAPASSPAAREHDPLSIAIPAETASGTPRSPEASARVPTPGHHPHSYSQFISSKAQPPPTAPSGATTSSVLPVKTAAKPPILFCASVKDVVVDFPYSLELAEVNPQKVAFLLLCWFSFSNSSSSCCPDASQSRSRR